MSEIVLPVVLLNRGQFSLQCNAMGAQKCLQVLGRDAELDGLALNHCDSSPALAATRSRKRKRRTSAYPFNQVRRKKASILGRKRKCTMAIAAEQGGSEQVALSSTVSKPSTNISMQDGSEQAAILKNPGSELPSTQISEQVGCGQSVILDTEPSTMITFEQEGCVHAISLNKTSEQTVLNATEKNGCELKASSNCLPTASVVAGKHTWTSAIALDHYGSEQATALGTESKQQPMDISLEEGGGAQAAVLGTGTKPPSTNICKLDGCEKAAILGTDTETTLASISEQDGSEESATLGTESKQPSTVNTIEQKDCLNALRLISISGQSSNGPNRDCCELITLSNSPLCIHNTVQDKSISKENFMALLGLSPTHVLARVRSCNHHKISKDLHIKSRHIWRNICGERNVCYSAPIARAMLRSFKLKVSLKRSNFIDRLALQPVPQSIDIKNLESKRPRAPTASDCRKHLINFYRQKPRSVNVVLKRDSDLDRLAVQISNVACTSCSSNLPGKRTADPSKAKRTSGAPLSMDTKNSRAAEKPRHKWLSVDIKRDSGLEMLAQQLSEHTMCALPSRYPVMNNVTPSKAKNTSKAPSSTGTTAENHSCKWLSVHLNRDSILDMLSRQSSNSTFALSSYSPGTCIVIPRELKPTTAVTSSTDSKVRDSGSGLDVLARKTTKSLFESLSSHSPRISIIDASDAKLASAIPPSTSAIHAMEKSDLKKLCIKINRDSCIDQLALQTSTTTLTDSGSDCNDSSVSHQPTPKLPLGSSMSPLKNVPRDGMKNSINHTGKLRLLPLWQDSEIPGPRTCVIKLRRLLSDDWSIIQPDEPGSESSGSRSVAAESADSETETAELARNPCVCRLAGLPTSSSRGSGGGFSHKTRSRDSYCASQQYLSAVPSEQTSKASSDFRTSAKRSFEDTPKNVSSVSCSNSSKRGTRSVLCVEESSPEWHYNENENPQKRDLPPVKTVNTIEKHSSGGVGKHRILRKSSDKILENGRYSRTDYPSSYHLRKPSISSYMSAKKPLAVKSPNHEPAC